MKNCVSVHGAIIPCFAYLTMTAVCLVPYARATILCLSVMNGGDSKYELGSVVFTNGGSFLTVNRQQATGNSQLLSSVYGW